MNTHASRKQAFAQALRGAKPGKTLAALGALMAKDAVVNAYLPLNRCGSRGEAEERLFHPLAAALPDLERRDDILLAGSFQGSDFIATCGHYAATFTAPLFDIPPTAGLVMLRYGEVHRMQAGAIVESFIHLDLVDLMRQAGVSPLPPSRGAEGIFPPPEGHGGLGLDPADEAESAASLALVEAMIFGGLRRYDQRSLGSMGMERYWTGTMGWYGPSGIGSTRGVSGFQAHHQHPFLAAFPDRVGGNHKARFGDGAFTISTGWPSLTATFAGEWLGCPPSGAQITMRVMDIWRREGDLLAENWVFIDIPNVMAQVGVDVFAQMRALAAPPT
jgi:predicted ester cyclase